MDQSEEDIKPFRSPRLNKDQGHRVMNTNNQVCKFTVTPIRESLESTRSTSAHNHEDMHKQVLCYSAGRIMESIPDKVKEDSSINKDSSFIGCGRSLQSLIDQEAGIKPLTNVNTVPMNIGGSIVSIC